MIQERFDDLTPYLRGLKIVEGFKILEVSLKRTWKVPKNEEIEQQSNKDGVFFYSGTLTFDEMLDWLENDIIIRNLEIEEKERLLAAKVEELKRVFETSSLDDLNNLQFSTEKDVLKLNREVKGDNKDKSKENGVTKELSNAK